MINWTQLIVITLLLFMPYKSQCDDSIPRRVMSTKITQRLLDTKQKAKRKSQNTNDDDDDRRTGNDRAERPRGNNDDDYRNYDDHFYDNRNCFETQSPFRIKNRNIVLRCLEVDDQEEVACSWPEVKRRCPCSCRGYGGTYEYGYDDVYNYQDDYGYGETTSTCSNVNHPFSIYRNYEKLLVYCSDLSKQEFQFACERERPRHKCPVTCRACDEIHDGTNFNDFNIDDWQSIQGNTRDISSCNDVLTQFQVSKNGEQFNIRCFNLLQNEFKHACQSNRIKNLCPVTCGRCSTTSNGSNIDNSNHHNYDDVYTYGYKDDDIGYGQYGGHNVNDFYGNHAYNGYNANDIFSDDDYNIIFIDDNIF